MFSAMRAGGAAQGLEGSPSPGRGRGWGSWGRRAWAAGGRRRRAAVGFEDVLPAFVHGGAVVQILLIELVFEPAIDAQFRVGFQRHGGFLL